MSHPLFDNVPKLGAADGSKAAEIKDFLGPGGLPVFDADPDPLVDRQPYVLSGDPPAIKIAIDGALYDLTGSPGAAPSALFVGDGITVTSAISQLYIARQFAPLAPVSATGAIVKAGAQVGGIAYTVRLKDQTLADIATASFTALATPVTTVLSFSPPVSLPANTTHELGLSTNAGNQLRYHDFSSGDAVAGVSSADLILGDAVSATNQTGSASRNTAFNGCVGMALLYERA